MNPKALLVFLIGAATLILLFWIMRPTGSEMSGQGAQLDVPPVATPAAESMPLEAQNIHIKIQGGKRTSEQEVVRVGQGETLTLVFTSDSNAELHLHGYDHRLLLKANVPYMHTFVAEHSGRFEYELHGHNAHHALGAIEVMPR